jgi:hypothetical protein
MNRTRFVWTVVALGAIASCGGRYEVGDHPDNSGGAGGSSGSTASATTSASTGGAGSMATGGAGGFMVGPRDTLVDPCVITSMKACQQVGCHGGDINSAGLRLDNGVLLQDFRQLVDRPNTGSQGVTMLGDPTGCPPGAFKLIDSAVPSQSLLWMKPHAMEEGSVAVPCGGKMPVIGTFHQADKECMWSWINSVIARL